MVTTKIVYDHRGRTAKNSAGPLEIRVTYNRHSWYIATGIKVTRKQWRFDRVDDRPDAEALNDRLSMLTHAVYKEVDACVRDGRTINIEDIRKKVWATSQPSENFIEWTSNQIQMLDIREGTRKHYTTLLRRLAEFGRIQTWADITTERIYEWDTWLHNIRQDPTNAQLAIGALPPLLSDAGIYNYHKCLRYLLSRAVRMGKITANPYNSLRGEFKHGEREHTEYLTEDEMEAFERLSPEPGTRIDVAHDLFIFQMYTGLAYSDAQAFDMSSYRLVNGVWCHTGERIKTGVPYVNQLLPPAVRVLQKYGGRIPKILNTDYNKCLKLLGTEAKIKTRLHSHLARHTFATFMLKNGVKIENLSKMLGHTNITRTQRYAKVLAESVHEDFNKIANLINKKNENKKDSTFADSNALSDSM